ncbi:preprotein translocase subunit YajC [Algivirga pacifica]|uniref:Sec translocon accessory complex subunit YajC n=1 Tax=Algivirga pacifica TaxID=1162670 RepID=A0ABP9D6N8_9BACT
MLALNILLQVSEPSGNIMQFVVIGGMILVFYFFMIRPQQAKQKKQKEFVEGLKKGDKVVTVGGMHGTIVAVDGNTVVLDVDKGTKIRFEKSSVSLETTQAAKGTDNN